MEVRERCHRCTDTKRIKRDLQHEAERKQNVKEIAAKQLRSSHGKTKEIQEV
jgi:hypothetical protein